MTRDTISLLQSLIRAECVNDGTLESGQEHRAVSILGDVLGAPDFRFEPAPGRVSGVWDLPPSDPAAPKLALMGHTDVVPVNAKGWTMPPFGAEIVDGFVWGRGAVDMLNVTAAMATVFALVADGEIPAPPGGLRYMAVADEEAGGLRGAKPLVDDHWDRVSADYLLTEVAYPAIDMGEKEGFPVTVGEKGPFWTRLHTTGTPGHASGPYGAENALDPLIGGLRGLFDTPSPVLITDGWREFIETLSLEPDLAESLLDPDQVDRAIDDIAVDSPALARFVHASTHLTISPTMVEGSVKANVIPDRGLADVDVRGLSGHDRAAVDEHLSKAMGKFSEQISIRTLNDFPANASTMDTLLWQSIRRAFDHHAGSDRLIPTTMTVSTDARFFRDRGTICYGVGWFDDRISFPAFLTLFHGHDERVSVVSVKRTENLLATIVEEFAGLTS